ncbi:MAG: hypothetical protein GY880_14940 [Planctomycetaceae bacterium]|nr:hypothetical protein [Planctomycetaceae bacterium]
MSNIALSNIALFNIALFFIALFFIADSMTKCKTRTIEFARWKSMFHRANSGWQSILRPDPHR